MSDRVLLLEDEMTLAQTLQERLIDSGFQVTLAMNVEESRAEIQARKFDLALLDVGLPDGNGFDVAKFLKAKQPQAAIVFLTAMGSAEDRIRGLELGAEDYIVKPFHYKELLLRIQNSLKRSKYLHENDVNEVTLGKARVNFSGFELVSGAETVSLSHKECALLKLLVERRGKVVSRDEILNFVWSEDEYPTPRTIDNFISRLRKYIEPDQEQPEVIKSVRGVGYQLI